MAALVFRMLWIGSLVMSVAQDTDGMFESELAMIIYAFVATLSFFAAEVLKNSPRYSR